MLGLISAFIEYLKTAKNYSIHTLKAYQRDIIQLQDFLVESISASSWSQIEDVHLRDWQMEMLQSGTAPKTIRRKISAAKAFFKFLIEQGVQSANPAQGLILPKIGKSLPKTISSDHLLIQLNELSAKTSFEEKRDYLTILILYCYGLRRQELINLRDDSFDMEGRIMRVVGKGNKERLIPLGNEMIETIKLYWEIRNCKFQRSEFGHFLLTNKGEKMYPKLVYNIVKSYLDHPVHGEVHPHILRHSFASHLLENGAKIEFVKSLLGHTSLAATQVYTHLSLGHILEEYKKAHPRS